jgi:hypothetical protein
MPKPLLMLLSPSPPSTLIYQGEGVSAILTQRGTAQSLQKEAVMEDVSSLSHTVWECKYHIAWISYSMDPEVSEKGNVWGFTKISWRYTEITGTAERE